MNDISGFSAISDSLVNILILGSMPSQVSLSKQQYYAHNRNSFWPIMLNIFNVNSELLSYQQRKACLIKHHIAVWDVLHSCHRTGSLDTAIKMNSIIANDFQSFFIHHKAIKRVFFNGAKAETIYKKTVLPHINQQFSYIHYSRLPSTSPAHASLTFQQKLDIWKRAIACDHV